MTYKPKQGETWDEVSYKVYGKAIRPWQSQPLDLNLVILKQLSYKAINKSRLT